MIRDFMGYAKQLKSYQKVVNEHFPELTEDKKLEVSLKFFEAENTQNNQDRLARELMVVIQDILPRAGVPLKPESPYGDL